MGDTWTVDIKDFQSLKHAHLEVAPGITTIVGKTNEGKSAIFRAIDAALFNMGDDSMIRGGQRYYGVSIDNGDHKMVFMRDGKGKNEKSAYQFDGGTVQKKVGRGQLPEVAKLFNVRDVRMPNGTKLKINFWYQNDRPFLTDKTSGQLYEFLSLTSCDKYSKVLKTMQADERVLRAETTNVTTEINTLKRINNRKNDFIDANDGFDDVYVRVVTLSRESKKVESLERLVREITALNSRLTEIDHDLLQVSNSLQSLPLKKWSGQYAEIVKDSQDCAYYAQSLSSLSSLSEQIQDRSNRSNAVGSKWDMVNRSIDSVKGRLGSLETSYGTLSECMNVSMSCKQLADRLSQVSQRQDKIQRLTYPDFDKVKFKLDDIMVRSERKRDLHTYLIELSGMQKDLRAKEQKMNEIDVEIAENERDLEALKAQAGYCPYCGTVFSSLSNEDMMIHLGGN